nr:hypothetical protein [Escherichia coli O25b:H4-ST131]
MKSMALSGIVAITARSHQIKRDITASSLQRAPEGALCPVLRCLWAVHRVR